MCAAVRTSICELDSFGSEPRKLPEGLMNHFNELASAPQYLKNAAATFPANAILIRSALEVGVVGDAAKVSGNISSK
jgi:hypothetical protein